MKPDMTLRRVLSIFSHDPPDDRKLFEQLNDPQSEASRKLHNLGELMRLQMEAGIEQVKRERGQLLAGNLGPSSTVCERDLT